MSPNKVPTAKRATVFCVLIDPVLLRTIPRPGEKPLGILQIAKPHTPSHHRSSQKPIVTKMGAGPKGMRIRQWLPSSRLTLGTGGEPAEAWAAKACVLAVQACPPLFDQARASLRAWMAWGIFSYGESSSYSRITNP